MIGFARNTERQEHFGALRPNELTLQQASHYADYLKAKLERKVTGSIGSVVFDELLVKVGQKCPLHRQQCSIRPKQPNVLIAASDQTRMDLMTVAVIPDSQ